MPTIMLMAGRGLRAAAAITGLAGLPVLAVPAVPAAAVSLTAPRVHSLSPAIAALPSAHRIVAGFQPGSRPPADDSLGDVSCPGISVCMAIGASGSAPYPGRAVFEAWDGSSWQLRPDPPNPPGALSCASATSCVALSGAIVGGQTSEVWNGKAWRTVPTADVGGPFQNLFRIACPSPTFCVAVGIAEPVRNTEATLIEQWDGRSWGIAAIGSTTEGDTFLSGVSCPSTSSCMAIGTSTGCSPASCSSQPLAQVWNGSTWTSLAVPIPGGISASFSAVSCPGPDSCVILGSYLNASQVPVPLAEEWNGTTWQMLPSPGTGLSSLSCTSAAGCVAVGTSSDAGVAVPVAEQWNGGTWQVLATADPGDKGASLAGVACPGPSSCMAVGTYASWTTPGLTLAEQWNGGTWRVRRTPSPGDPLNGLLAVSCRNRGASSCMAVGAYINAADAQVTLAEQWNGRAWHVRRTPSPGPHVSALSGLSCTSGSRCVAVGGYFDTRGVRRPLAEAWNGSTWRLLAIPAPAAGELTSVACPAAARCIAVGSRDTGTGALQALAERWDGSTWHLLTVPSPDPQYSALSAVSCISGSSCIAVGVHSPDPQNPGQISSLTLTEAWNGHAWRVLHTPDPGRAAELTGITCRRPPSCMAVGNYVQFKDDAQASVTTFAQTWNGSRWQLHRTASPPAGVKDHLNWVSCTRPSRCMAVGGRVGQSGNVLEIAQAWNGRAWRLLHIPSPTPRFSDLYSVSCTRAASCVAVGETGAQQTLAEKWNGTRWRMLPTSNP